LKKINYSHFFSVAPVCRFVSLTNKKARFAAGFS